MIVFEHTDAVDLGRYLHRQRLSFSDKVDLLRNLAYLAGRCHDRRVAHGNLRLENVLVGRNRELSLVDFESSVQVSSGRPSRFFREFSDSEFTAPEILARRPYDRKLALAVLGFWGVCGLIEAVSADVWSLGVVFYRVLYGRLPFRSLCQRFLKKYIIKDEICFPPNSKCSEILLIKGMLHKTPGMRMSLSEVLKSTHNAD